MSTTYGVSVILGLLGIVCAIVVGSQNVGNQHRAQQAADLSALSAASVHVQGVSGEGIPPPEQPRQRTQEQPCDAAGIIAGRNGAALTRCEIQGERVYVAVTVGSREAAAVAGPVE